MKLNIALLPGDGIGPEVTDQAVKSVKAVCRRFGHEVIFSHGWVGAAAIDRFGDPFPEETHRLCMASDAVLFGAIGDPKYDNNPGASGAARAGTSQDAQGAGAVCQHPAGGDFSPAVAQVPPAAGTGGRGRLRLYQGLTGGIYFGERGRRDGGSTAFDTCTYTREEITRILKLGFEFARKRNKKLTVVDKANILESSRLWREVAREMSSSWPDVTTEYMFVDNAAMQIIQWPRNFDVLITENMFGDILTDEASVITGSMGLLPSASVGTHTSVFEPIHGSWPQAAGKNIANPVAAILSAAMMFEYAFSLPEEGRAIRDAVKDSLEEGIVTGDIAGEGEMAYSTSETGDWIAARITSQSSM